MPDGNWGKKAVSNNIIDFVLLNDLMKRQYLDEITAPAMYHLLPENFGTRSIIITNLVWTECLHGWS
ncbi:hypothetical protein SADUNF_Sadunf03G0070700 [Salix dunnii]|uniref:Uncharacterized protein n=1 Tax=Salix dunnii TaxID=1413687 RepID=A0A835K7I0_9ROSI|nr:hypothetical protein SADUNF_Sadunf03G0070700 [Salix dunnii]